MSGARFVRFYPSDWRSGCIGLTLEQEGFYIRICAFIYDTDQRLPVGDDSMAAKLMGLHTNAYRKIRDQLVALGKLVERAGYWTVPRADRELAAATSNQARAQERQADPNTGRETRQDTIGDTHHNSPQETPIEFSEKVIKINGTLKSHIEVEDKTPLPPKGGPTPSDALRAFEAYNQTALRCNLQQASKMTPDRQRKIIARLKDYGIDGWTQALANIERSSFLTGRNDKGWSANLDFMLQASSFSKLHDGAYGNGRHTAEKRPAYAMPTLRLETEDQKHRRLVAELEAEGLA